MNDITRTDSPCDQFQYIAPNGWRIVEILGTIASFQPVGSFKQDRTVELADFNYDSEGEFTPSKIDGNDLIVRSFGDTERTWLLSQCRCIGPFSTLTDPMTGLPLEGDESVPTP